MAELRVASWNAFRDRLRADLTPESYDTWFKSVSLIEWESDCLKLGVRNRYVKQWIEDHYGREVVAAAQAVDPETRTVELNVLVPAASRSATAGAALERTVRDIGRARTPSEPVRMSDTDIFFALPGYRLDDFVVGACNRLPHSACLAVAERPAGAYNPLVLHGDHGLGKTHLLQGLAHDLRKRHPELKVKLATCEEFANEYLRAIQDRKLEALREAYRTCHVLLMDNVHFLCNKEKTQDEFLFTFDALQQMGRQIVLTCDEHPRRMKGLDQRLAARFQSGLVARLDRPDFETRASLIHNKGQGRRLALDEDLAELLAMRIDLSVRELEGAVCKLAALSAAEKRAPDKEMALLALRELGYLREGPLSPAEILEAVVQRFGVEADAVRGGKRHAALVRGRHLAMYLCKQLTSHSLSEIGRFFGNRDHSTVLHAVRKIDKDAGRDEELAAEIQALRRSLGR
ncbi:MAG: chromosomal replication initiator protein DnaA [Planctomycetota bacterium]|nr:chromosomal replication initiator protein DnaA [Planctomycetota bacterium]